MNKKLYSYYVETIMEIELEKKRLNISYIMLETIKPFSITLEPSEFHSISFEPTEFQYLNNTNNTLEPTHQIAENNISVIHINNNLFFLLIIPFLICIFILCKTNIRNWYIIICKKYRIHNNIGITIEDIDEVKREANFDPV